MSGSGRKTIEIALFASFALSGAAALIAQAVWQRELVRLVGATTPGAAVVYAGVMAGLGAGALLGNAILSRGGGLFRGVNPLRFLAALEAISCGFALLYALAFRLGVFSSGPPNFLSALESDSVRQALAFIFAAAPSLAMGATWPAAVAAAEKVAIDVGKASLILYSANLSGAFVGAACGAFCLIPSFGLSVSLGFAGALNFIAALIALIISLAAVKLISPRNPIDMAASSRADSVMPQFDCLLVFLSAFATLSLEVIFTRLFTLLLGSSTYSVGVVLCGVLIGASVSAALIWILTIKSKVEIAAKTVVAIVASLASLVVFAEACLINRLPDLVLLFTQQSFERNSSLSLFHSYILPRILTCSCLVFPPIFFVSIIFPLVLSGSLKSVNSKTARSSWLYSASTFGAVIGSLSAGLYLIPAFSERYESGLLAGLIVIAGICLMIAALAASHQIAIATNKERQSGIVFLGSAALIGFIATMFPPHVDTYLLSQGFGLFPSEGEGASKKVRNTIEKERGNDAVLFYREGLNTTVTVEEMSKKNIRTLKNDGKVEAAIPLLLEKPAPTTDYPTQILLGLLPYALGSHEKNNTVVIGCGSGATYGALAKQKGVAQLTVAEIEKAVFEASQFFLPSEKKAERADIRKLVCDARNYLAYSPGSFELIVSQPAEPWVNGAGDLYTRDFFELIESKLAQRGVFCQWLQLYAIDENTLLVLLNTIQSVFPSTYVFHPHGSGEILIVSFKPPAVSERPSLQPIKAVPEAAKLDISRITTLLANSPLCQQLKYCHVESVADLLSMLVLTPLSLDELLWKKLSTERLLVNTDDNLLAEYAMPSHLMSKDDRIEKNLELLHSLPSNILPCLKGLPDDVTEKAEILDRVALSMAGFSQKHPGEGLDESALSAAYEAWTLSESPAIAAACDVISNMTGRIVGSGEPAKLAAKPSSPTAAQAFWIAQSEALKGHRDRAIEVIRGGLAQGGPHSSELASLLKALSADAGIGVHNRNSKTGENAGTPHAGSDSVR